METIQAAPNGVGETGIPSGCILMWSGTVATIPSGWHLCDGTSGTPDLRNRFIVGAGSSYSPGNTGGSESVALSVSQMPSHTHVVKDSGHQHSAITITPRSINAAIPTNSSIMQYNTQSTNSGVGNANISCGYTGSGSSHENRPPYYALCFIMKL